MEYLICSVGRLADSLSRLHLLRQYVVCKFFTDKVLVLWVLEQGEEKVLSCYCARLGAREEESETLIDHAFYVSLVVLSLDENG